MVNLFFRVADASSNVIRDADRVEIWDRGTDDPTGDARCGGGLMTRGMVQIDKYVGGHVTPAKTTCVSNSVAGTNEAQVSVSGRQIDVSVNGMHVLSYADPKPIAYGGVGVGEIWETTGWFDNVQVEAG
jgi:hypothetical protein